MFLGLESLHQRGIARLPAYADLAESDKALAARSHRAMYTGRMPSSSIRHPRIAVAARYSPTLAYMIRKACLSPETPFVSPIGPGADKRFRPIVEGRVGGRNS